MAFVNNKRDGKGNIYNVTVPSSNRHSASLQPTGLNDYDVVCNIYDLEGNLAEYTAEKNKTYPGGPSQFRGGRVDGNASASNRRAYSGSNLGSHTTFRFVLYVM